MKSSDITVGGYYKAKISGNLVTVRVDAIREATTGYRGKDYYTGRVKVTERTVYDVTNLSTNRQTTFRSAAKFRSVSRAPSVSE